MAQSVLSKVQAEKVTQRTVLADGSLCFRTSKFTEVVTRLAPGRVLVTAIGYNDGRCAPLITAELSAVIAEGSKVTAFCNFSGQTGQATASREWWVAWVRENRAHLQGTHMFVRSRIMNMAISVLGMLVGGGITAHADVVTFEAAIAELVPGFRHLPEYRDLPPMLP